MIKRSVDEHLRLVGERAHVSEPTSKMRVLLSIQVHVDNSKHLSINAGRGVTNTVGVVQEVLVELLESLEDYS